MMLMKNVKIDADCPGTIMVGEVIIHITRITDSRLSIGVDAPKDQPITTSWPRKSKPVDP
jgi:sRNA-binding carbon storage regulator CsrA